MSAPLAFGLIYERLMRNRTDAEALKADAALGMPGAQARLDASRREVATAMHDIEVG